MKFTTLRPIFWTEKLEETIQFYTEILGFSVQDFNQEWKWASLTKDAVEIMLTEPNEHETYAAIGFTGSFYFNVENVDEVWANLKDKAKICCTIDNFPWNMREFAIYDNNGYILQFGEELPPDTSDAAG